MAPDDCSRESVADAPPSMEELFARYRRPLQAFFGKRVGYDAAEDYTQETFLRFAQAGYIMAGRDLGALLFTIAANLFRDHLRRLRRERDFIAADKALEDDEALNVPSDAALPDQQLESGQDLQRVLAAIERLPPRCAAVFLMHRLQGKSHEAMFVKKRSRFALVVPLAARMASTAGPRGISLNTMRSSTSMRNTSAVKLNLHTAMRRSSRARIEPNLLEATFAASMIHHDRLQFEAAELA